MRALLALALVIAGLTLAAQPATAAVPPPGQPLRSAPALPSVTIAGTEAGTVVKRLPGGGTLTTTTRRATAKELVAAGYPCCGTYLHVSGISNTGKPTCLKIGITTVCVDVLYRSYEACEPYFAGLVYSCEAGSFYFNPNTTACGTTCTQGGQRGTHTCNTPGNRSAGYSVDITGCGNYRIDSAPAPIVWKDTRQWKQMTICVYSGIACGSFVFHVDLRRDGSVTLASGG